MVNAWEWVKGKIQPVTASLSLFMLLLYLRSRSTHLDRFFHPQSSLAWRALLSVFYHKNGLHLFVNIIWIFNIGSAFEKIHGSWYFLCTTTSMVFLSQGLTLLIYLPYAFYKTWCVHVCMPKFQLNRHTLGFSGVLFALYFLLLRSTSPYSRGKGFLLSSNHHGLIIEGLLSLAGIQSVLVPDSHFLNNTCGLLAGIAHNGIPCISKDLIVLSMIIYGKIIHPMSHIMYKIFQKVRVQANVYHRHLFHQYSQSNEQLYKNARDDGGHQGQDQEQQEEEESMDSTLQWECKTCLRINGVFFHFCVYCREWRRLD